MAADTAVTFSGTYQGQCIKMLLSPNGDRVGVSGEMTAMSEFKVWAEAGCDPEKVPNPDGHTCALWITPENVVHIVESGCAYPITTEFIAIGSGTDIATGAMAHGATAAEAVEIACRYDTQTNFPVMIAYPKDKAPKQPKKSGKNAVKSDDNVIVFPT